MCPGVGPRGEVARQLVAEVSQDKRTGLGMRVFTLKREESMKVEDDRGAGRK